jgi:GT2 family glycosyltransferase
VTPRLTIVTACYNHAHYLGDCMSSVDAQTEKDIEHIIVIDGATDYSADVAMERAKSDPRVFVIPNRMNRGLAAAQNIGIRLAASQWVLKVDADDTIDSRYVEEILRAADDDPSRNIIFSPAQHFGSRTDVYTYPPFEPRQLIHTLMIAGCAAMKRELWDAVGGYDETMRFAEDWDLHIRAQLAVGLVPHQLSHPLWSYRVHDGPRASHEGIKRLPDLRRYWRGHTRESAMARSRSWGEWCSYAVAS